jgi:translin
MVADRALPSPAELGVPAAAWLNGLAEAASELRRHLLDRLRAGELSRGEALLAVMDEAYGLLVTIDYPDAVSGGLRRTTDALRAVLERTRGDLTITLLQSRLQAAIESGPRPAD